MTRFKNLVTRYLSSWREASRKPVTTQEYRTIGFFAALFTLLMAAMMFFTTYSWQMAALTAAFSMPASLIGGVLCVAIDRRPKTEKPPKTLPKLSRKQLAFNVIFGLSLYAMVCYATPSRTTQLQIFVVIGVVDYALRRVYRQRGSSRTQSSDASDEQNQIADNDSQSNL